MGRSVNYASDSRSLDWFVENIQEVIKTKYKSFTDDDSWVDRELHSVLENDFAQVIVFEYCGLVSISLVPKELDTYYDNTQNLANSWCDKVSDNFIKLISDNFKSLNHLGTFSNRESVFEYI